VTQPDASPPTIAVPPPPASAADEPTRARRAGLAYLGVAALSYGGLWPAMRLGAGYMPPIWFALVRLLIGSAFLFLVLAATGRLRRPQRADLPVIFTVGVMMMGLYVVLVHYALQFVPAGRGALLGYSTPLWVTPFAVLFQGEKLTRCKLAGLVLGLTGLAILFNPAGFDWTDRKVLIGNGMLLLAAFSWSFAILHMRTHRWNLSPLQLGPWQLLVASIVALPAAMWLEPRHDVIWAAPLFAIVAYGGIIGTGIAMFAATSAIRLTGPVTASIGLLGGPVVALTVSVLFLGEPPTPTLLGGLVMILSGIALVSLP
jgi:drug/metabolite transporter (DMT)-like permease